MTIADPLRKADDPALPAAPVARKQRTIRNSNSGLDRTTPVGLALRYVLLIITLLICIGPFLWQLSTSLKSAAEDIYSQGLNLLPSDPTFDNYATVTKVVRVWDYSLNSLTVAGSQVLTNCIFATLAGYALQLLQFRGRKLALGAFFFTLLVPGEVTIISQLVVVNNLGLVNTLVGVILPGAISSLNVLLMYNAFKAIPPDLFAAAGMDGANAWQRFRYIALPNVKGTVAVVAIFAFVGAWDDFLWPFLALTDPNKLTLTVGLAYLKSSFGTDPRLVAAGTMIALIPVILVFASLQRYFFRGVAEGGVKG